MSRIQIDLPGEFVFSTEIPIMIGNINRGNHLAWDAVLSIMEEARIRFLNSLGFRDENVDGVSFIVVDAAIMYRRQGRHGQILRVEIAVTGFSSKGCDIVFRISDAGTGEEMVRAKTGVLFYDYRQQKVAPVPEEFKKKVPGGM
ncbi:MAG: thioesterase [Chloroflexi bacterium RBG_16_57_8]|nr:MAG: thioesterase [Chloroflexi bacterium RBG_16_57_8]